jgi:hypothetical protein
MLGRKDYTKEELDHAKTAVDQQVAAYKKLAKAIDATPDSKVASALEAFEPLFFNNMTLALDRPFVREMAPVDSAQPPGPLRRLRPCADTLVRTMLPDD